MLKECYRRTGDKTYLDAAVNLEHLFTDDAAKEKMATFQDTVHLFLGLYYMGPVAYKDRIEALRDQIMLAQNDDGSWHEEGKAGSPGAVYTTGQVLWTLMETGMRPETDPRLEKGLRWLLTKQQIFGGWFQTDSHENFRTPMRETRYALMALSAGYPRPSGPLKGIGNPNGGPAIAPAVDATPVDALDALENIWEVPADQVTTVAAAIHPLLARPEPPVRAAAAAALGRIAGAESVEPLLPLLRDPSKLAWREGAWALRQLGNQGHSVNTLLAALRDSDPLVRRSASRAFAYQFQGMDGRMDIAHTFVRLASDPDLLTRLQALRTLRQWFYRSDDPTFKLTVIQTVIDRMGVPETPVMRTNLAQNMYILLDENQSGGVSMQRNLRDVPDQVRENVLNGRKKIEETVLLQPVLKAMAAGNELQREALLESFDGSFFKGRFYARVPRDMIDVGNDREFSFMYTPDQSFLEATLGKLIESEPRNAQLRRGIQLASFFEMPSQSASATLQLLLLSAMFSNSPELQDTAREVVRKDLVLRAQEDERIAAKVSEIMSSADIPAQGAILAALTRSPDSLALPQVQDTVRAFADRSLEDESASMALVPLVNTSILDDTQALAVLEKSWKGLRGRPAAERIPMIEALAKRTTLIGNTPDAVTAPRPQQDLQRRALRILEDASTDPDVALREKLFALLPDLTELRRQARVATLLYAGLSDESPAIRIKSLKLAEENNDVWNEEDVHEYVMKNLIAADPKVRKAALDTVVNRKLLSSEPRYAARVKSVIDGDTELADSATNALREANVDPAQIKADASIAAVQAPDLLYFRDHVNNYLYLKGADQNACADCHATHTILGLAEPHQDGSPLTDSEIVMNYRSLLKVVNTVDPEQSLILRKPRSPFGTGAATTESPTGVTHVGGVRWGDETADPAYQAILAFIRTASTSQQTKPANSLADSYSPEYPPAFAIDANPSTIWHTEFVGAMPGYPHELVLDLGSVRTIHGATYLPRQESDNGRVAEYEIYVSADNQNWGEPIAKGVWPNDASPKTFFVAPTAARYIKLRGLSEVKGQPFMSAAEFEALVESATTLAKE